MTISKEALKTIRDRGKKLISEKMADKFKNTGMAGALENVFVDTLIIKAEEDFPANSEGDIEEEWQKNVNKIIDWIHNPKFTLEDFLEFARRYDKKIDKDAIKKMLEDTNEIKKVFYSTRDKHAGK